MIITAAILLALSIGAFTVAAVQNVRLWVVIFGAVAFTAAFWLAVASAVMAAWRGFA